MDNGFHNVYLKCIRMSKEYERLLWPWIKSKWNVIKVTSKYIHHSIKGLPKLVKLLSSLTTPNNVWLKFLKVDTWYWQQLQVPLTSSHFSTEIKNLEGKKSSAQFLVFCQTFRSQDMLFWIFHLTFSHFISKQKNSRRVNALFGITQLVWGKARG